MAQLSWKIAPYGVTVRKDGRQDCGAPQGLHGHSAQCCLVLLRTPETTSVLQICPGCLFPNLWSHGLVCWSRLLSSACLGHCPDPPLLLLPEHGARASFVSPKHNHDWALMRLLALAAPGERLRLCRKAGSAGVGAARRAGLEGLVLHSLLWV